MRAATTASYELFGCIAERGAFARVRVRVEPASASDSQIDPGVLDEWNAQYPAGQRTGPATKGYESLLAAAQRGCLLALERSRITARTTVLSVYGTHVDTDEESVFFAAAHATWRALGMDPPVVLEIRGVPREPQANARRNP